MSAELGYTSQAVALAVVSGFPTETLTSQFVALGIIDGTPLAEYAITSQALMLAVVEESPVSGEANTSTSQFLALGVYGVGAPEDLRLRAWGFTMDGHRFYVLHLGEEGTFVYDLTTKQWAEWKTEGFDTGWNAYVGLNWGSDDRIVAADRQNPTVWLIDPETFRDEGFKDIRRTVTAIIPQSGFGWATHDSLQLYASVGDPSAPAPTIELTFSDDQGVTYDAPADSIIVLVPGENTQQIDWMSLGSFQSPGRVIDITDYGGVGRIDRASVEIT